MVVLTPHWHSEGEPGKHTWSGRSAPPPLPPLAWTCPVPRGVSGCWGFRGGAGGLYLRSHRPPATLLAQPPASWGQRGRDPPHPLVERIALIWGLPPPSRPCRVGGALWEMVGGFGWRERRQTAPAVKGRRPALRRGAGSGRGHGGPRRQGPDRGRPGFSTSLTWFMGQWPPLTRSVLPDPPPRRAWAPSSPRPGWDPARCCGWRGRARDPSASPCRLLPSEPHPSRPLTALPLLFWAASQKNGQA